MKLYNINLHSYGIILTSDAKQTKHIRLKAVYINQHFSETYELELASCWDVIFRFIMKYSLACNLVYKHVCIYVCGWNMWYEGLTVQTRFFYLSDRVVWSRVDYHSDIKISSIQGRPTVNICKCNHIRLNAFICTFKRVKIMFYYTTIAKVSLSPLEMV